MFNPGTRQFEYREGAAMCNFLLADESTGHRPKLNPVFLK